MFRYFGQRSGWTLAKEICFEGIGLMSGQNCKLKLLPEYHQAGYFLRLKNVSEWTHLTEQSVINASNRTTIVKVGSKQVMLVEHLFSSLKGMGIDHVAIEIEGEEIPILDGSSYSFAKAIQQVQRVETTVPIHIYELTEPFSLEIDNSLYVCSLDTKMSWHCVIDYPQAPVIGFQTFDFSEDLSYIDLISPARTFCLEHEIEALRTQGLLKGASLDCGVVFNDCGPINSEGLRTC
jgi:UDP-3-O-[3-hydroxymyristoyl] N-acetylglucosamine deacetylase